MPRPRFDVLDVTMAVRELNLYCPRLTDAWRGETCIVIGNGPSSKNVDYKRLRSFPVKIAACNRAYADITPDLLTASDKPMMLELYQTGTYKRIPMLTQADHVLTKKKVRHYWDTDYHHVCLKRTFDKLGMFAGGLAVGAALCSRVSSIYLVGHDLVPGARRYEGQGAAYYRTKGPKPNPETVRRWIKTLNMAKKVSHPRVRWYEVENDRTKAETISIEAMWQHLERLSHGEGSNG